MRKTIGAVAAAGVMLVIAACGGGSDSSTDAPSTEATTAETSASAPPPGGVTVASFADLLENAKSAGVPCNLPAVTVAYKADSAAVCTSSAGDYKFQLLYYQEPAATARLDIEGDYLTFVGDTVLVGQYHGHLSGPNWQLMAAGDGLKIMHTAEVGMGGARDESTGPKLS